MLTMLLDISMPTLFVFLLITGPVITRDVATVQFLHSCRQADGGYSSEAASTTSTLPATSAALRALKHLGVTPQELAVTRRYVWSCWESKTGQFRDSPTGKPGYRATAVGIMAVAAMGERFTPADLSRVQVTLLGSNQPEEVRLGAAAIETLVLDGQLSKVPSEWQAKLTRTFKPDLQPEGHYGTGSAMARTTAGYSAAYLRLGYSHHTRDDTMHLLMKSQHASGGWMNEKGEPDFEATYRVMRCLHLLKCQDSDTCARVRRFVANQQVSGGGYALVGQKTASVSATYYATSILQWLANVP
jgi:hypothetical protein